MDPRVRINNRVVANHFHWDFMDQVDWRLVMNNLRSFQYVLDNPAKHPKANVQYLTKLVDELDTFVKLHNLKF